MRFAAMALSMQTQRLSLRLRSDGIPCGITNYSVSTKAGPPKQCRMYVCDWPSNRSNRYSGIGLLTIRHLSTMNPLDTAG